MPHWDGKSLATMVLLLAGAGIAWAPPAPPDDGRLILVHEDFSEDPGWEAVNNRIVCQDCPAVSQDFGWSPTNYTGSGGGEIGGEIWRSTTPAWYGLPIGKPLTWDDTFSASGRIVFRKISGGGLDGRGGAAYLGFFNAKRQGWRPWSSVAIRLIGETDDEVSLHIDYMTAQWGGYGDELEARMAGIGKPHTWSLAYDPHAVMPPWQDKRLESYLGKQRQTAEQIHEKAKAAEPGATLENIKTRLAAALAEGYVRYFFRAPHGYWTLNEEYGAMKGAITVRYDGGPAHRLYVLPEHRGQPLALDRFGIFNLQMYHSPLEFYVSDLTLNGRKIDLSRDPQWDARGNRVRFIERDFHRLDFGYSATNWAGREMGEIGGLFYRTEAVDPLHGYYADAVGELTLEEPLSFSASAAFVEGSTDAGMFLGYFNAREKMAAFTDKYAAQFLKSSMGVVIEGPTRVGYYASAQCTPTRELNSLARGPVFLPTGERRRIAFNYDPRANGGRGRITVKVDGAPFTLDLTAEQRAAGAAFDRFGLMNIRRGGKFVRVYFDDLTYTARKGSRTAREKRGERPIVVPYPPGGRQY